MLKAIDWTFERDLTPLQNYQTAIYAILESAAKELGVHEFEVLAGTVGYRLYHMTQVATRSE